MQPKQLIRTLPVFELAAVAAPAEVVRRSEVEQAEVVPAAESMPSSAASCHPAAPELGVVAAPELAARSLRAARCLESRVALAGQSPAAKSPF